eukprot:TRINITY_DN91337_c0_g1_i1.p1 TRINITY_DN91337_c0_g1~~TRINITY_DN91337_c0_g1_i1.p1  ORF type:complete len:108 (-),score=9.47 TRINITY_DN91337_c0_g1_i1:84-368(-)
MELLSPLTMLDGISQFTFNNQVSWKACLENPQGLSDHQYPHFIRFDNTCHTKKENIMCHLFLNTMPMSAGFDLPLEAPSTLNFIQPLGGESQLA